MKLRKPCPHDLYDEHRLEGVAPWAEDLVNWPMCLGGVFLPDDTLIIERGPDGKFPEWITDVDGPVWYQCGGTDDLLEEIFQAIKRRERS